MSKAVMISIRPEWCELIASGKKTIEVRKTKPKIETPFKCYIYESSGNQMTGNENFKVYLKGEGRKKVIGEFVCDGIIRHCEMANADIAEQQGFIHRDNLLAYSDGKELFGWHISDLVIYDRPKELSEFYTECDMGCENCDYWKSVRVNADEFDMDCDSGMHGHKPIKRAPQSWCYIEVEEV